MTDHELQKLVMTVSQEVFHEPFKHEALFNRRLRTTGGRYMLLSHNIEINPRQLAVHGEEAVIAIIKHELCHYHLHLEGKGYRHRDQDFKKLCQETGAPRYCAPVTKEQYLIYRCSQCGIHYQRKRRINIDRYRCGKCHGKLELVSS
ncbi:SprT family protein [Macrococcus brunensis]|uniref:SprT family protein n=1 Tax=Macrococcus brunensis TaxID=198483 RepID=UPI001EF0C7E7|nr:SprT family protein [Macrococcus brunensis]ULG71648.1 SprT family protein [Macrococcus brunensis]